MAKFTGITFNEKQLPDFVKVINISHSILPPVSQNLLTLGGKAGAYDFGNAVGTREITVDISIIAPEENVLPSLLEELSAWLYYEEAKELILGDNPNRYYLAKFSGSSDIKEQFIVGEGSITFVCTDPYIYGNTRSMDITDSYAGEELAILNTGNAEALPKLKFEITKALTNFSVVSGEDYIDFGSPYSVDDSASDIVDAGGYLMNEKMDTTNGWSVPSSVYGGTIAGGFEVNLGNSFRQSALDYGSGLGWHGASLVKGFAESAQDFEANMMFKINVFAKAGYIGTIKLKRDLVMRSGASTKYPVKKTGKVNESYQVASKVNGGKWLKLTNGYFVSSSSVTYTYTPESVDANKLGKLQFTINDVNGNPLVVAQMYDSTSEYRSLQTEVRLMSGGSVQTIVKKLVTSDWHDCTGYYNIRRKGNIWEVSLFFWNGQRWSRLYVLRWVDAKKIYSAKVNALQVATLAYGTYPASYMEIRETWVKSHDVDVSSGQIPLIMRAGDVLEIDNNNGSITLNNTPFYQYLNPSSTFIKLQSGVNGLVISPPDAFRNGSIEYTERTL